MPIDSIAYFNLKRSEASETGPWTTIQVLNQQTVTATNPFTVPAKGSDVTVVVADVSWVSVNQYVNVALAGLFKVVGKDTANSSLALRYLNEPYNTRSGNVIPVGSQVLPGSYEDSFAPSPKVWYLLEGITANGITITYNVVSVEGAPSGPGTVLWAKTWTSPADDRVFCCATDVFGNIYVGGDYSTGIYIRKMNSSGALLWERQYSTAGGALGITIDPSGYAYVVGFGFGGFFPGEGLPSIPGLGAYHMPFIIKYAPDATGTPQWARGFPPPGGGNARFTSIAYHHATQKLWISGSTEGGIDFGGGLVSSSGAILLKLNSTDGSYSAVGRIMPNTTSGARALSATAVDTAGNVYVTSQFANTMDLGNGIPVITAGAQSVYMAKFNSSGVAQWGRGLSTDTVPDEGTGVAVDNTNGFVYFTGTQGGTNFDAGNGVTLPPRPDPFRYRGYLLRMTLAGVAQWVKSYEGGAGVNDYARCITLDSNNNIIVGGQISGPFNFGGGVIDTGQFNQGFTVKYNSSGVFQWAKVFGSFSNDSVYGVAADTTGNVYSAISWYAANFAPVDLGDGIPRVSNQGDGGVIKYSA